MILRHLGCDLFSEAHETTCKETVSEDGDHVWTVPNIHVGTVGSIADFIVL